MTSPGFLESIRDQHSECCITSVPGEKGCRLNLERINRASLVMLHGSRYQEAHGYRRKLCDRIIFGDRNGVSFICVVELKGGKNVNLSEALEQIQNGLNVAQEFLGSRSAGEWYPLLLFDGRMGGAGTTKLRGRGVSFRQEFRAVTKRRCGSALVDIL